MTNRTDNFNRADAAIGSPSDGGSAWDTNGYNWRIASNQARIADTASGLTCVVEASTPNTTLQATLAAHTNGGAAGLTLRYADSNNYIMLRVEPIASGVMTIHKKVGGSYAYVNDITGQTLTAGDVIKLSANSSNQIIAYLNGTPKMLSYISDGETNTKHGLYADTDIDSARWDDFSATDLTTTHGVTHDAVSESHTGTTGDASHASFNWQHTPVGAPAGILVFTFVNANANNATAVDYGGVTLTAVSGGRAVDTATEAGDCKAWFVGSANIPAGPQTVTVTRTNNSNVMYAVAISVLAAAPTEVYGVTLQQNDQAPAQASISDGSTGIDSVRYAAANYGGSDIPVAGANSTALIGIDFGTRTIGVVRETTAGQGSRSVGFADASDDWACVLLAVREALALGTLSKTLAAATLSGTGAVGVAGTLNSTLAAATLNGTSKVGVAGTLNSTLDAATLSGTGKVGVAGTLNSTLDAAALSGTGKVGVAGTLNGTLDAATLSGSGTIALAGRLDSTLDAATLSGSGTIALAGALDSTLDEATLSGSGTVSTAEAAGTLNSTLDEATLSGSGAADVAGTLNSALDALTLTGSGATALAAALAATLDALTLSADVGVAEAGALNATLDIVTLSGAGAAALAGVFAGALDALTLGADGTASATAVGTLTGTLDALTLSADMDAGVSGTLNSTLDPAALSASGSLGVAGTYDGTLAALTATAEGSVNLAGQMIVTLDAIALTSAACALVSGALSGILSDAALSADGAAYSLAEDERYRVRPHARDFVVSCDRDWRIARTPRRFAVECARDWRVTRAQRDWRVAA